MMFVCRDPVQVLLLIKIFLQTVLVLRVLLLLVDGTTQV